MTDSRFVDYSLWHSCCFMGCVMSHLSLCRSLPPLCGWVKTHPQKLRSCQLYICRSVCNVIHVVKPAWIYLCKRKKKQHKQPASWRSQADKEVVEKKPTSSMRKMRSDVCSFAQSLSATQDVSRQFFPTLGHIPTQAQDSTEIIDHVPT